MKILILGANGQLGKCLVDQFKETNYTVEFVTRKDVDITEDKATSKFIRVKSPTVVINASAYTAVDKAESEKLEADRVNHLAVGNLANICKEINCYLIHISTDFVFDGHSIKAYKETDRVNPISVYGKTKLCGENVIRSSGCEYIIIRTSWVFSEYGNNFLKTMLRLGEERDCLEVIGDQYGCPTYAQDIAKAIILLLPLLPNSTLVGTYHYAGDSSCSWYDFANYIFAEANKYLYNEPLINKVTTLEYPTAAIRPKNSSLGTELFQSTFSIAPSNWRQGVQNSLFKLFSTD